MNEKRDILVLCRKVVHSEVPVSSLKEFAGPRKGDQSFERSLCDALWLLDLETLAQAGDLRKQFIELVKAVFAGEFVSRVMLEEALEVKLLEEAGIVASGMQFFKQVVIQNTRMNLTQPVYFLLHEASEGYSRLVTQVVFGSPFSVDEFRAIVGRFSLDLGRAIDLYLSLVEGRWHKHPEAVNVLQCAPSSLLLHLLGLRLSRAAAQKKAQTHLLELCAHCIKEKLVSLEGLYALLSPGDDQDAREYVSQLQKLQAAEGSIKPAASVTNNTSQNAPEESSDGQASSAAAAAVESVLPSSIDGTYLASLADNQRFGLLMQLLSVDDWTSACAVMRHLADRGLVFHVEVQRRICAAIHRLIEPLYRTLEVCGPLVCKTKPDFASFPEDLSLSRFADIPEKLLPPLRLLGPLVSLDSLLFCKLCRLFRAWLVDGEKGNGAITFVLEPFLARYFLPALGLFKNNPAASGAVFQVLDRLPFDSRCRVYAVWRKEGSKHPLVSYYKAVALVELKFILRRLNADQASIASFGRLVGALSHSFPLLVFDHVIAQVQQYSNMISPVVEFLKFSTLLGRDSIVFVLLEALVATKRAAKKQDGTNLAEWLASLASFVGLLCKKYKEVECGRFLELIAHKLRDGSTLELAVFEQIILRMTGIEAGQEGMSEKQLEAQAGSAALKAAARPVPAPPGLNNSAMRLKKSLETSELVAPLMLLIAQNVLKRGVYGAPEEDTPLKAIGDSYDRGHAVWLQYLEFLEQSMETSALSDVLPSMHDMVMVHKLSPAEAFTILRSVLTFRYGDVEEIAFGRERIELDPRPSILADVETVCPGLFSSQLYVAFWTLRLSDIVFPKASYDEVVKNLQKRVMDVENSAGQFESWDAETRTKEIEKLNLQLSRLGEDEPAQQARVDGIRSHFRNQASVWMEGVSEDRLNGIVVDFMKYCVMPRCRQSAEDAVYCAEFVFLLHNSKTLFFSTVQFYDVVLRLSSFIFASLTEYEAANFGRFLGLILEHINRCKSSEKFYNQIAKETPGFSTKFKSREAISFQSYLDMVFVWHKKLSLKCASSLESKNYLVIRNTLLVLTKIVGQFPEIDTLAANLASKVKVLVDATQMSDVKLLATRYDAMLSQKTQSCVSENVFKGGAPPAVVDPSPAGAPAVGASGAAPPPPAAVIAEEGPSGKGAPSESKSKKQDDGNDEGARKRSRQGDGDNKKEGTRRAEETKKEDARRDDRKDEKPQPQQRDDTRRRDDGRRDGKEDDQRKRDDDNRRDDAKRDRDDKRNDRDRGDRGDRGDRDDKRRKWRR